ncbi:MAG: hypothetical protein ABWX74_19405 [Aeromicrobium sp.]
MAFGVAWALECDLQPSVYDGRTYYFPEIRLHHVGDAAALACTATFSPGAPPFVQVHARPRTVVPGQWLTWRFHQLSSPVEHGPMRVAWRTRLGRRRRIDLGIDRLVSRADLAGASEAPAWMADPLRNRSAQIWFTPPST